MSRPDGIGQTNINELKLNVKLMLLIHSEQVDMQCYFVLSGNVGRDTYHPLNVFSGPFSKDISKPNK